MKQNPAEWRKVENEDEDEETLRLHLAAIEAKIKLKKLREKKNAVAADSMHAEAAKVLWAEGKENSRPPTTDTGGSNALLLPSSKCRDDVQIPLSPQRKKVINEEAKSPGRVILGIDKGLKGRNISLKRPLEKSSKDDDPFKVSAPSKTVSRTSGPSGSSGATGGSLLNRPKSFSEKIAATRLQDKERKEKSNRSRKERSNCFGINQQDIDAFHTALENENGAEHHSTQKGKAGHGEFSREEVLRGTTKANDGRMQRSTTTTGVRRSRTTSSTDIWLNPNVPPEAPRPSPTLPNEARNRSRSRSPRLKENDPKSEPKDPDPTSSLFESFSSLHLSKRLLPHDFLTRSLSRKHIFLLPDLLSQIKSPYFTLPEISESDYVILALIASKSPPLNVKGTHKSTSADSSSVTEAADSEQNTNGKYMILTLTNLKWTLDLYLFATGYTRFRKLTPGTLIAVLNPDIMPPPPGKADTNRFSLKLSSSDDTVLEIGTGRDLGWCKSVRKDGKQCESWIDKRHTEHCEFHVDIGIERMRRGRMEVQGLSAPFAPGGRKGGRTGYFGDRRRGQKDAKEDRSVNEGPHYDRGSSSRYFVAPSLPGQSAAELLDAEGATDRYGSRQDRVRKRLAEREKENEIARRLGEGGNGAGSKYMRVKQGLELCPATASDVQPTAAPVDAASLGFLGNQARNVHLSPIKKRKAETLGNLGTGERSRKKTRFVTERGIREAGRESFGGEAATEGYSENDDLEVV